MVNNPYLKYKATAANPYAKYAAAQSDIATMTGAEFLAQRNADDPLAPSPVEVAADDASAAARRKEGNFASRAIGEIADQRLAPGIAGTLAQGAARTTQAIAADPIKTLITDPAAAPTRILPGLAKSTEAAFQGKPLKSLGGLAEAATAAGETALIVSAPFAGSAARSTGSAAAGAAARPTAQFLQDTARLGVKPTLPAAAPQTAGRIAKPLSENFAGGVTLREGAKQSLEETVAALERTASLYSDSGYLQAGRAAKEGVQGQFTRPRPRSEVATAPTATFKERARDVYDNAFAQVDMSAQHSPQATREALNSITARFDNQELAKVFSLPRAEKLQDVISGQNALSINDLRQLRTAIREIQGQPKLVKSIDDAALERLEGSLTKDIFDAVKETAGPKAARDLRVADRYYRQNITSLQRSLKEFMKSDVSGESAFGAVYNAAKGNAKGDIQRLRSLRRTLSPEQMDDVSAGVLRRMGYAKEGGEFSPRTFANEWRTISPEAKDVLFNRTGRPEVRQNLDALTRVISRQSEIEGLANFSNSAVSAQNVLTLVGIGSNPVAAFGGIVGANAMGRLMMSPSFTKVVLQLQMDAPRFAKSGAVTVQEKARILALLAAAENSDAAIRPYVREIRAAVESANDNAIRTPTQGAGSPLQQPQPEPV